MMGVVDHADHFSGLGRSSSLVAQMSIAELVRASMTTAPSTGRSTESTTCQLLNDTAMADVLLEHRATATRAVRSVLGISRDEEDLVQETLTRLVIRLRQPGEISVGALTR